MTRAQPSDALVLFGGTGDLARKKIYPALQALAGHDVVRGQYSGYRNEDGVNRRSQTETFAAARLHVDSRRWGGVPFFIRAGKRMAETATEVLVELKRPPQQIFAEPRPTQANYVHFRLGPDRVAIAVGARTKKPGEAMVGKNVENDEIRA